MRLLNIFTECVPSHVLQVCGSRQLPGMKGGVRAADLQAQTGPTSLQPQRCSGGCVLLSGRPMLYDLRA